MAVELFEYKVKVQLMGTHVGMFIVDCDRPRMVHANGWRSKLISKHKV